MTAAKSIVQGKCAIDMLAGPSEVLDVPVCVKGGGRCSLVTLCVGLQ